MLGSSHGEPGEWLLCSRDGVGDWIVVSGEYWRILGPHVGKKNRMFILGLEERSLLWLYMINAMVKQDGVAFRWNPSLNFLPSFLSSFLPSTLPHCSLLAFHLVLSPISLCGSTLNQSFNNTQHKQETGEEMKEHMKLSQCREGSWFPTWRGT